MSIVAKVAASGRSSGFGTPAAFRAGTSAPSSAGTGTGLSTRAISVPRVVSAANGTSPLTDSMITRARE